MATRHVVVIQAYRAVDLNSSLHGHTTRQEGISKANRNSKTASELDRPFRSFPEPTLSAHKSSFRCQSGKSDIHSSSVLHRRTGHRSGFAPLGFPGTLCSGIFLSLLYFLLSSNHSSNSILDDSSPWCSSTSSYASENGMTVSAL